MTIAATRIHETSHGNQKRLKILGTSLKKLERSTSFLVAPHVMLYEKRCARIACDTGMERPPKKKKLRPAVRRSNNEPSKVNRWYSQERNPHEVLPEGTKDRLFAQTIFE